MFTCSWLNVGCLLLYFKCCMYISMISPVIQMVLRSRWLFRTNRVEKLLLWQLDQRDATSVVFWRWYWGWLRTSSALSERCTTLQHKTRTGCCSYHDNGTTDSTLSDCGIRSKTEERNGKKKSLPTCLYLKALNNQRPSPEQSDCTDKSRSDTGPKMVKRRFRKIRQSEMLKKC